MQDGIHSNPDWFPGLTAMLGMQAGRSHITCRLNTIPLSGVALS